MSNTDAAVLNEVMTGILMELLSQGEGKITSRTGKVIKNVSHFDKIKLRAAKKGVEIAFKYLPGDADEKFRLIVDKTNQYLPNVIEILGEEAIVSKLEQMPEDSRDAEVVAILDKAGATELSKLLRKALPEGVVVAAVAEEAVAEAVEEEVVSDSDTAAVTTSPAFAEAAAARTREFRELEAARSSGDEIYVYDPKQPKPHSDYPGDFPKSEIGDTQGSGIDDPELRRIFQSHSEHVQALVNEVMDEAMEELEQKLQEYTESKGRGRPSGFGSGQEFGSGRPSPGNSW